MLVPSPRAQTARRSLRPWQVVDVEFTIEQRDYILESLDIYHDPFPMSLLEARVRRRASHHWLPEKTRVRDAYLVGGLRARHTCDAEIVQVFHKSRVFLLQSTSWKVGPLEPGLHLEPGTAITIRFRNGRRPTTWNFLLRGTELVERQTAAFGTLVPTSTP